MSPSTTLLEKAKFLLKVSTSRGGGTIDVSKEVKSQYLTKVSAVTNLGAAVHLANQHGFPVHQENPAAASSSVVIATVRSKEIVGVVS
ncbi:unnamed protein product [Caenorhabditis auriculariae]|uniref:Uncharacterized protein n=1 Tax=Caenorhabditis auriculariae TaxID=2777116 RepID=A0A8S1H1D9_9PELO|nr:unnamed protein product [Caenorhabditis auriculariae]